MFYFPVKIFLKFLLYIFFLPLILCQTHSLQTFPAILSIISSLCWLLPLWARSFLVCCSTICVALFLLADFLSSFQIICSLQLLHRFSSSILICFVNNKKQSLTAIFYMCISMFAHIIYLKHLSFLWCILLHLKNIYIFKIFWIMKEQFNDYIKIYKFLAFCIFI